MAFRATKEQRGGAWPHEVILTGCMSVVGVASILIGGTKEPPTHPDAFHRVGFVGVRISLHGSSLVGMGVQTIPDSNSNEKRIQLKPSDSEVFYTNSLILLVKNMLRSKLHCQKAFK